MRKLMTSRKGFTLIELMIVILIIAILVAIAVPVYLNSKSSAQKRTCQANQRTIDGAIQSYQTNDPTQTYPGSLAQLTATGVKTLKTVPTCPTNGQYTWTAGTPPYVSCTSHQPSGG